MFKRVLGWMSGNTLSHETKMTDTWKYKSLLLKMKWERTNWDGLGIYNREVWVH